MSEEEGLEKTSAQLPSASDASAEPTALSQVEQRIAKANSPQEALFWTQIRGEIIKQNEVIKEGKQGRFIQNIQIWRRIGVSVAALTIGLVLFINGSTEAGLLVLGAFLYELAPDLVKETFSGRDKGKEDD
ncbi:MULTISPECIES: hypothetical protein [Chroococcidiopsis]|jgi:hypothetical protein|uniref:Uncharacterized protein n=1 Tax=Chroococcidiopsis thermalis (strain PCC 7203) TaxID=251229 RepID=K9U1C0_CHRTP|nr:MULTISPECIES: hypothetical protein [Chroococcidiopsis]AFY88231.1 hypothetical protein Chro_2762 [Chroococcidiopsis thermalis PCC 7203]PSB46268.1 hypothetical protein C7B80_14030 [Cyanosarcina cf. burmensis CCALA 770]URD53156.1 hypothetical protein M5J74_14420 [Chroococcidiopsis sp. CCNUC1]